MKTTILAALAALTTTNIFAESLFTDTLAVTEASAPTEETYDADNGIVTIGSDRMFQIESKDHRFSFKPYLMLQTTVNFNYYDDEGLDKAYNQDNVANSGFSFPYEENHEKIEQSGGFDRLLDGSRFCFCRCFSN